jgi:N-sulfoglucosamine sulfohydrolase
MMGKRPTQRALRHDREALFDLEADPLELHNLINNPAHMSRVEQMRAELTQHRVVTKDPWLEIDFQEGAPGVEDPGG